MCLIVMAVPCLLYIAYHTFAEFCQPLEFIYYDGRFLTFAKYEYLFQECCNRGCLSVDMQSQNGLGLLLKFGTLYLF